jgi:hypothetical protein
VRRFVVFGAVFCAGVVVGILGSLAASREPVAWLTIVNRSSQALKSVCIAEDRFNSRYCLKGPLRPGASEATPVIARGEVGYSVAIEFANGAELQREFYAETGYRVEHVVSDSEISYDPSSSY